MNDFKAALYEGILVAFGKILAKYDVFTQGVIMRDIGKEVVDYLNDHDFGFEDTDSIDDLSQLINLFVENGFAESLEVTPADLGDNYIWKNLYGINAYKELYDLSLNPFLACPLNLCMCYVAGKHNKKLFMHRKEFISDSITEAQYELVDDDLGDGNLDKLVLSSARLFEIADERQKKFHQQAITDPLTGLYNLRFFLEEGKRLFEAARIKGEPISVMMLDIDHFKKVNDNYGHSVGDEVLQQVAKSCLQLLRETDLLARYGGEEFVVVLPRTDLAEAKEVAERLRRYIAKKVFDNGWGEKFHITVSIGVCADDVEASSLYNIQQFADMALLQSKRTGRDKVSVFQTIVAE